MDKRCLHNTISKQFHLIGTHLCLDFELTIVAPDCPKLRKSLERGGYGRYMEWDEGKQQSRLMPMHVHTTAEFALSRRRKDQATRKPSPKLLRYASKLDTPISRLTEQYAAFDAAFQNLLLQAYLRADKAELDFPEVEDLHRLFLIAKDMRC